MDYKTILSSHKKQSIRGRYSPTDKDLVVIENAINGAGSWIICQDQKDAVYQRTRYREIIRENFQPQASIIKVSVLGGHLFLWNKKLYKKGVFDKQIFLNIREHGKLTFSKKKEEQNDLDSLVNNKSEEVIL